MSEALGIAFTPGSLEKLSRSMRARQKLLNEDSRKTVQKTAIKVLTALRASARVSPKLRKVNKIRPTRINMANILRSDHMERHISQWYDEHGSSAKPTGKKLSINRYIPKAMRATVGEAFFNKRYLFYAVKSRKTGENILLPIPKATTLKEAKLSRAAQIFKRALARSSFTWMMGKLGSSQSSEQPEEPGVVRVRKMSKDENRTISINLLNSLKYIVSALKGGKRDVATALERGRAMLDSDTRRALQRRLGTK